MNVPRMVESLAGFANTLPVLLGGIEHADAIWRPADGGWSILDILGHLADEEIVDFRPRLKSLLGGPLHQWAPVEPERRVEEARARLGSIADQCARFVAARQESVVWLRGLVDQGDSLDWAAAHEHPQFGPLRAGDMLLSWAAHDVLHARQLMGRQYELLHVHGSNFSSGYASP